MISCLLFFNCCLIVVGFFPLKHTHTQQSPPWRSTIKKKGLNVAFLQKWASHCLMFIGQIHFLASSGFFCFKTDLKHLENLSIQVECSSAFFPRHSGVICDRSDGLSAAIYSHFPRVLWSVAKQNSLIMGLITICSLCERIQGEELEGAVVS